MDTAQLARDARRHRVLGLLRAGLPMAEILPADENTAWQKAAFGQAQYTARCAHEAERIFGHLKGRVRRLALVKGPVLAMQAWPNPGLRSFDDLDFRCDAGDLGRLTEALASAGYEPELAEPRRREHLWAFGWGVSFADRDGLRVEVNHRSFPPQYPWPQRLEGDAPPFFIEQALDHATVRAPAPALHLLYACLHAIWHGWERLAWLADIAGLLVRHPTAYAEARAWASRCGFAVRGLDAGCDLAENVFGPGLLPSPPGASPADIREEALALLGRSTPAVSDAARRHCHRRLLGLMEYFIYEAKRVSIPGDGDFKRLALPRSLRGLYWILRPFRAALAR